MTKVVGECHPVHNKATLSKCIKFKKVTLPHSHIPARPSSSSATPPSCPRNSCCPTRSSRSLAGTCSPAGPGWRRWAPGERRCHLARSAICKSERDFSYTQACKLKFRLRDFTSCLCSAAAPAVCFKGCVAGVDAIETGNEFSQLKFNLHACNSSKQAEKIWNLI